MTPGNDAAPRIGGRSSVGEAARILRAGGVVAFPTETVYGLGAVAFDGRAVARVFEVKRRPSFDPLIVHVAEMDQLPAVAAEIPPLARDLMARFWPGPLTLVLPKAPAVSDLVTSGLPTVAVRMPDHPLARALIRETGAPLAAPSANRFGCTSPTLAEHVAADLGGEIDLVLDGGPCRVGVESTILLVASGALVLLRPGGLAVEEIEAAAGLPVGSPPPGAAAVMAPGNLPRHYAPRTLLTLSSRPDRERPEGRTGLLAFRNAPPAGRYAAMEILSPAGDLREAAARLFAALRRLDRLGLDALVAEPVPEEGLGRAINDRLRRAATQTERD